MGRILEYVVLLSSLSLILAVQQYKELSQVNNYEREKQDNFTHTIKQYLPKDQNEFFSKKALPLDFQRRRRPLPPRPKQMRMSVGLHAFASKDPEWKGRKRNSSESSISFSNLSRRNISPPPFSPASYPQRNSKNSWTVDDISSQRLSRQYIPNNSLNSQTKRPEEFYRRYHKEGKNGRYHSHRGSKACDPCSSVPWIPLLKVPESYRQQRTHVTELYPTSQQNFNFDYHAFASNTHNVLLPPVPLVPPLEPVYDGTISSSFGLPVGNIPTSHGLLAPINHLTTTVNKYGTNTIDYSNSFNYFAPQGLLENHAFPELSSVPIVPIHDSGQFYQFDSKVPDLVPPPTKTLDVSKVVLTISEENSAKREPSNLEMFHNHKSEKDLNPESNTVDSQTSHSQTKEENQSKGLGKFEIVKSIPLAEFTSSVAFPHQDLPLYPPLQSEFSNDFIDTKEHHSQILFTDQSTSNFDFLVPPPKPAVDLSFKLNKSADSTQSNPSEKPELQGEFSAPKPLTSPSLSWLFPDHTAPPSDSKNTASVFATETQEIASIVNNELRPVSPHPLSVTSPSMQNAGAAKSKKIQIIIPYTTKNKNGHDNNAIESVQHEMFQPPVSESAKENGSLGDFATSALPSLTHLLETNREKKVIDGMEKQLKTENKQAGENKNRKYLSEMHHIIASNIRELLKKEIQKSQSDQNYPLQKNIDNWTALEYSNHKTVETKAPKEIINQALAVTSIPGTSISHLLLPSKKIPDEYFVTTPLPLYDEPNSSVYKATNSTVNSSPFTAKPYASTSIYNPTRTLKENGNQNKENKFVVNQANHEKNYTELGKGKVNNWGRLNENLVLPEARSKTRRTEQTTSSVWTSSVFQSSGTEKVQIVTPVSLTTPKNHTMTPFRRTTRHIHRTVPSTTESPNRKMLLLNRLNSTRLEKVSNQTLLFNRKITNNSISTQPVNFQTELGVETTNSTVLVDSRAVKTNITISPINQTSEEIKTSNKSEHLSINDIFPFRNKKLPWESNVNGSQPVSRIGRQRKSLIKQVNLKRIKTTAGSS